MGNASRQIKRRREKELKQTAKPKNRWSKEKKIKVFSICGIVALLILLFLMFWTPAGTVKTWFGKPMFVSKNEILVKTDNYYRSLGTYTLPEGYSEDKDYSVVTDANRFEMKAYPLDENSPLHYFYITPVASPNIDAIRSTFAGMYEDCTELQTMNVLGREAKWFASSYAADQSDTSLYVRNIVIYIPAQNDSSILVSLYSPKTAQEALPSVEDMLSCVDSIVSGFKLK